MIRIVLVDDQRDFRIITRLILSREADMEVVGEAVNGVDAVEIVADVRPDVVLMDVEMPILDGIAATRQIHAADPNLAVVLLTGSDDEATVSAGLRAGAVGHVLKNARPNVLLATIRAVNQGRLERTRSAENDQGEQDSQG